MSPSNVKIHILPRKKSKNLHLTYKFNKTNLGNILIGYFESKICHVSFQDDEVPDLNEIKKDFPQSILTEDTNRLETDIFSTDSSKNIDILLTGTDFQLKTWQALTEIEHGTSVSYETVAKMIGRETAIRAVANAISKNKIAYLIPCHRVINKNGKLNNYKWGKERKRILLEREKV